MTIRERYLSALTFGRPDRIPFEPGEPREKTLKRWWSEGLPKQGHWFDHLCAEVGIQPLQPHQLMIQPDVNFRMHPLFEEKVLEHRDGHYIVQDWMGNITEISDEYDYTYIRSPKDFVTRRWLKFPVQTRADFEEMKKRYDADDPCRYPLDFKERVQRLRQRDYIVTVSFSGPFWQLREWCGFEPLCMLMVEDPEFVLEMIHFWTNFVSRTMERVLAAGIVDRFAVSEDMAYKEKSMISPAMTRKFLLPAWSHWIEQGKQAGVLLFDMDSDGRIDELIPVWLEAGFNVCDPIEVAAGCDIQEYRRLYGRRMAYRQGVDKRCIAKGGKSIEDEIHRLSGVIKEGGYIPGCDHGVPHDISWPDFIRYATLLADVTGWL